VKSAQILRNSLYFPGYQAIWNAEIGSKQTASTTTLISQRFCFNALGGELANRTPRFANSVFTILPRPA
jgi:hypothetical protein